MSRHLCLWLGSPTYQQQTFSFTIPRAIIFFLFFLFFILNLFPTLQWGCCFCKTTPLQSSMCPMDPQWACIFNSNLNQLTTAQKLPKSRLLVLVTFKCIFPTELWSLSCKLIPCLNQPEVTLMFARKNSQGSPWITYVNPQSNKSLIRDPHYTRLPEKKLRYNKTEHCTQDCTAQLQRWFSH